MAGWVRWSLLSVSAADQTYRTRPPERVTLDVTEALGEGHVALGIARRAGQPPMASIKLAGRRSVQFSST